MGNKIRAELPIRCYDFTRVRPNIPKAERRRCHTLSVSLTDKIIWCKPTYMYVELLQTCVCALVLCFDIASLSAAGRPVVYTTTTATATIWPAPPYTQPYNHTQHNTLCRVVWHLLPRPPPHAQSAHTIASERTRASARTISTRRRRRRRRLGRSGIMKILPVDLVRSCL